MFIQELRRPWSLCAIALMLSTLVILILDRWREPPFDIKRLDPLAQWTDEQYVDTDLMAPEVHKLHPLGKDLELALPDWPNCSKQECNSPFDISEESANAVREYCRIQDDALREIYAIGAGMSLIEDTATWARFPRYNAWTAPQFKKRELTELLYQDMLRHTLDGEARQAIDAAEAIFKVAHSFENYIDAMGQSYRLGALRQGFDAVRVLINRIKLNPAEWQRLCAMTATATSQLLPAIREAFAYEAVDGLRNYYYPEVDPYRAYYGSEILWQHYWRIPRSTGEIVAESAFRLSGFEMPDQARMVRFAVESRESFDGTGELKHYLDEDYRMRSTSPGYIDLRFLFDTIEERMPECVAFPLLLGMAAQVECHRQLTGVFPDSLDDLNPGCSAVGSGFKDPIGGGDLIYRRTESGVVLYSKGLNRFDDLGNRLSKGLVVESYSNRNHVDDDICIELRR